MHSIPFFVMTFFPVCEKALILIANTSLWDRPVCKWPVASTAIQILECSAPQMCDIDQKFATGVLSCALSSIRLPGQWRQPWKVNAGQGFHCGGYCGTAAAAAAALFSGSSTAAASGRPFVIFQSAVTEESTVALQVAALHVWCFCLETGAQDCWALMAAVNTGPGGLSGQRAGAPERTAQINHLVAFHSPPAALIGPRVSVMAHIC